MQFRAHPARILSLVVLLAVMNVFVFANGTVSSAKNANESASAKVVLGKLVTNSNRPILVNGGEAITGTNILSGAQLMTPAASLATVNLANLGSVMIAPSSRVTLTFDLKNITVNVASGDAIVTTVEGVKGTVIGPDGIPAASGPSAPPAPAPAGGDGLSSGEIAGIVLGGVGTVFGILSWKKAGDAQDDAAAAAAAAAAANAALAAAKACLAGQTASPVKVCTSF
jgi:hypothetical protein